MRSLLATLFLLVIVAGAERAFAACSSPAGVAGQMLFQSPNFLFCDGTNWTTVSNSGIVGLSCADNEAPMKVSGSWTCVDAVATSTASSIMYRDSAGDFAADDANLFGLVLRDGLGGLATIRTPTGFTSYDLVLPSTDGDPNQVLMTNGSGVLSWGIPATSIAADSLDFDDFVDSMTLDASTNIAVGGSNVLSVTNSGTGHSFVVNDSGSTSDSTPFVVSATGNVGIGDSSPSNKLSVNGSARISGGYVDGLRIDSGTAGYGLVAINSANGDPGRIIFANGQNSWAWDTAITRSGPKKIKIDDTSGGAATLEVTGDTFLSTASGNVGIGTTSPDGKLDVQGSIVMSGSTSGYSGFQAPATAPNLIYTMPASAPTAGHVLSSDASGVLSWAAAGGGADNLGNHTATEHLKLGSYWLSNDGDAEGVRVQTDGKVNMSVLCDESNANCKDLSTGLESVSSPGNLVFGAGAGAGLLSTGLNNILLGANAGTSISSGDESVVIGREAGKTNTTGFGNIFIGSYSGNLNTGDENTIVGSYAGTGSGGGYSNAFLGAYTGEWLTTGYQNTFTGYRSGQKTTDGYANVFSGYEAGNYNTSGYLNVFQGYSSGHRNTTSSNNTAVGTYSLAFFNSGAVDAWNTAVGAESLKGVVGSSTGVRNTALGAKAGDSITTGNDNILIGYNVDTPTASTSSHLNIGNAIYGNLSTGSVGIGTGGTAPNGKLDVKGSIVMSGATSGYSGFQVSAAANNMVYTLPVTAPTAGQFLSSDASGVLSWAAAGGGVAADSLDFDDFIDAMTLDASTDIAVSGSNVLSITNTGTANSLVVNDQAGDTTPFVIDAAGKVGVGTASPAYKLHVESNTITDATTDYTQSVTNLNVEPSASAVGRTYRANLATANALTSSNNAGTVIAVDGSTYSNNPPAEALIGGKFEATQGGGLGTTSALYGVKGKAFNWTAPGTVTNAYGVHGSTEGGVGPIGNAYGGYFLTEQTAGTAGTITNGYGVYAQAKSASSRTITNGYGVYAAVTPNSGTITNRYGVYVADVGSGNSFYNIYSAGSGKNYFSGNVGIGTTNPNQLLTVEGVTSLRETTAPSATANYGKLYVKSADSKLYYMDDSGSEVDLTAGGGSPGGADTQIQFNSSGSFGGSSNFVWDNSGNELTVTGDISYSGILTDTSDVRLKTDIQPLTGQDVLNRLMKINTYSFRMKEPENAPRELGVMAQEVEKHFPELVKTANDAMGTKSVNYQGLIAPLIETTRQLQREIASEREARVKMEAELERTRNESRLLFGIVALLSLGCGAVTFFRHLRN